MVVVVLLLLVLLVLLVLLLAAGASACCCRRRRRRLLLPLLLLLSIPFEGEAISAAPWTVGAARRRFDALVWVTGATRQMGSA